MQSDHEEHHDEHHDEHEEPIYPDSTKTVPVSRDTLLLIGALLFLIVAVTVTLLLPSRRGDDIATNATLTALPGGTQVASGSPYPEPGAPTTTSPYPEPGAPTTTSPYPEPGAPTTTSPYPEPGAPTTAQPGTEPLTDTTAPTFDPTRTTPTAAPTKLQPTYTPLPTYTPRPTQPPLPTYTPRPTQPPLPTSTPTPSEPTDTPTSTPTPAPTEPPVETLSGSLHWNGSQGPIVLHYPTHLTPGSILIIEPGTEIRLAWGASLTVDGAQLHALGSPEQPVRFVGHTGERWEGIYGRNNSLIVLENAELRGGGAGGTVLHSQNSELVIRNSYIVENGGTIQVTDSKAEMRDSEVWGNDFPYGGAFNADYSRGNYLTLTGNRIGRNRVKDGMSSVVINATSSHDSLNVDIQGNVIHSDENAGANLQLSTNNELIGTIACNSMIGANTGLRLRTETPQLPTFNLHVHNNHIDAHVPPIIPYYLKYGIGRGATSEVELNMSNNWWGDPSGPYHPEGNPEGRGDSVGSNIAWQPWLHAPPPCAPMP